MADSETRIIEELTKQRDVAVKHIADWCIAVEVNGSGWSGWDDWGHLYKDALHNPGALPEIRELLDAAIAIAREDAIAKGY